MPSDGNRRDYDRAEGHGSRPRPQTGQQKTKPDAFLAFMTSIVMWAAAMVAAFTAFDTSLVGWIVMAVVVILVLAGIFWRPLRSGFTLAIVMIVPVWGLVARLDRITTCRKLRTSGIYVNPDPTRTIPATTWRSRWWNWWNSDVFVRFDGRGEAGMSPDQIRRMMMRNARVWGCRSFAISEDTKHPGLYTIQLSTAQSVRTSLDDAVIGVFG